MDAKYWPWILVVFIVVSLIVGYAFGKQAFGLKVAACFNRCPDNWIGYSFDCVKNCIRW